MSRPRTPRFRTIRPTTVSRPARRSLRAQSRIARRRLASTIVRRAAAHRMLPRRGRRAGSAGMATAEYAIATLAACGFAGLLVALLRSGEVQALLMSIVRRALEMG